MKFETILKIRTRTDYLNLKIENLELSEYVKSSACLNGGHVIFGRSGSGKTLFTVILISAILHYNSSNSFAIILMTKSNSAHSKFRALQSVLKQNFENITLEKKCIEDVKDLYDKLKNKPKGTSPKSVDTPTGNKDTDDLIKAHDIKITTPTHYIFFFDDCIDEMMCSKNADFFTEFASNHRHSNITALYTIQQVAKIPGAIKNNTRAVYLAGQFSNQDMISLYRSTMISDVIYDYHLFKEFMKSTALYIENPVNSIIIFNNSCKKKSTDIPTILYYKASVELADMVDKAENQINEG